MQHRAADRTELHVGDEEGCAVARVPELADRDQDERTAWLRGEPSLVHERLRDAILDRLEHSMPLEHRDLVLGHLGREHDLDGRSRGTRQR